MTTENNYPRVQWYDIPSTSTEFTPCDNPETAESPYLSVELSERAVWKSVHIVENRHFDPMDEIWGTLVCDGDRISPINIQFVEADTSKIVEEYARLIEKYQDRSIEMMEEMEDALDCSRKAKAVWDLGHVLCELEIDIFMSDWEDEDGNPNEVVSPTLFISGEDFTEESLLEAFRRFHPYE